MKKVYLTGYEKQTITEFINKLLKANITTVIDIRKNPISRKAGFSKNALFQALKENDIKYFHCQDLGTPNDIRNYLKGEGDYLKFFQLYRSYLHANPALISDALDIIYANGHSVLMCYEKDCELCHRSILASELMKRDSKIQAIPL